MRTLKENNPDKGWIISFYAISRGPYSGVKSPIKGGNRITAPIKTRIAVIIKDVRVLILPALAIGYKIAQENNQTRYEIVYLPEYGPSASLKRRASLKGSFSSAINCSKPIVVTPIPAAINAADVEFLSSRPLVSG